MAALRRDLEREFEDKRREAKLQEKRIRDRLAQDRADWETHRREQAQVLADKAEALRRQIESAQRKAERKSEEQKGLEAARRQVDQSREALDAATAQTQGRVGELEGQLAKSWSALGVAGLAMALVGAVLVALVWVEDAQDAPAVRVVGAGLGAAGLLLYAQSMARRRRRTTSKT